MEKLFFTALVVIVTVGGVFASSLIPNLWSPGNFGAADIECEGGFITCAQKYGMPFAHNVIGPFQNDTSRVDLQVLYVEPL